MEIIKRARRTDPKFRVIRPFWHGGKPCVVGEEIEILAAADQTGFCQRQQVRPVDLPETGVYIALREISLPGKVEKFTCKKFDQIELRADDALRLMLEKACLPADPDQWRPYRMRLAGSEKISARELASIRSETEKSQVAQELAALKGERK